MSLRIWLPLNGDLKNYGASETTLVTNSGATVNASGKIGSCYYFNNHYISYTCDAVKSFTECSVCLWVKVPTTHSSYAQVCTLGTAGTSWTNIKLGIDINGSGIPIGNVSDGSTYTNCNSNTAIKDGVWHHLCFTYISGTSKIYIDGVLKATQALSITPSLNVISNVFVGGNSGGERLTGGYINDYRVYDHCLSLDEVKEISKALVLYYPLDRPDDILSNKYSDTYAKGSGSSVEGYTKTKLENENGYNYKKTYTGTGSSVWYFVKFPFFEFTVGKTYYYSAKVRCNKFTNATLSLRASRSDNDWVTRTANVCSSALADGKWHEYRAYQTINSTYDRSGTTVTCNPRLEFFTGNLNGNGTVYDMDFDIKDVQVVESDIPVSFIDNSTPLYTIHDDSGYNRNGTVTSSTCPIIASGSARNSYCYQFDGTDDYIIAPVSQSDIFSDRKFTVSAWTYLTNFREARGIFGPHESSGTKGICFCQCNGANSAMWFSFGNGSSWITMKDPGGYFLNTWVFYTMTYDGTTAIIYRSGTEIARNTGNIVFCTSPITIARAYNGSDRYWQGKISNIKVYSTVLSSEDITKEYNRYAAIYKNQCFATHEFVEDDKASIGRNGIITGNLIEGDYSKVSIFPSNGNIQAAEFIEGI